MLAYAPSSSGISAGRLLAVKARPPVTLSRRWSGRRSIQAIRTPPHDGSRQSASLTHDSTSARLDGVTFHGLRHSFVAILVAAGCNVREVSEWAGHNSVAFTLTRYVGLFEDGSAEAVERLDALLSPASDTSNPPNAGAGAARRVHAARTDRHSVGSR